MKQRTYTENIIILTHNSQTTVRTLRTVPALDTLAEIVGSQAEHNKKNFKSQTLMEIKGETY